MSDNVVIKKGIFHKSSLSLVLFLFYNADSIEIYYTTDGEVTDGRFVYDICLQVTSPSISQNCLLLKETYLLLMTLAECNASKFDLAKYKLLHLLSKKNVDLNTGLVMSDSQTIKAKTSGVFLEVEIDNILRMKQYVERIEMQATMSIFTLLYLAGSILKSRWKTIRVLY